MRAKQTNEKTKIKLGKMKVNNKTKQKINKTLK